MRIDNVRQLRRHAVKLLNDVIGDPQPEIEKYKLINSYINSISKIFQIESTSKVSIDVTSTEMTESEMNDVLDKLKRMLE